MNKMPKVSIYITPKELERINLSLAAVSQIAGKGEKLLEIRAEGKINYHDLKNLLKAQKKEFIEILDGLEMKITKGSKSEFRRIKEIENAVGTGYNLAIHKFNNKIKQIKQKYG